MKTERRSWMSTDRFCFQSVFGFQGDVPGQVYQKTLPEHSPFLISERFIALVLSILLPTLFLHIIDVTTLLHSDIPRMHTRFIIILHTFKTAKSIPISWVISIVHLLNPGSSIYCTEIKGYYWGMSKKTLPLDLRSYIQ